jgi:hypothetical protein
LQNTLLRGTAFEPSRTAAHLLNSSDQNIVIHSGGDAG